VIRRIAPILWLMTAAILIGASIGLSAPAKAETVSGCEEIHWGFLGYQRRAICDSVRHDDGGWLRVRVIYRPAFYRNATSSCYGGYYSSSCTFYPAGWVDEDVAENTSYIVYDYNILPGEPGQLVNGFRT
jgi:hypothetical protein